MAGEPVFSASWVCLDQVLLVFLGMTHLMIKRKAPFLQLTKGRDVDTLEYSLFLYLSAKVASIS